MHNLIAKSAFGEQNARENVFPNLSIQENFGINIASITARNGQLKLLEKATKKNYRIALPGIMQIASKGVFDMMWVGPDQYFFFTTDTKYNDIFAAVKIDAGSSASITEQTDAWVRFDITGDHAIDLFPFLCSLDVNSMPDSNATRTVIEHLGCFVMKYTNDKFSILGPRSSAGSLHHAIINAANLLQ